MLRTFAIINEHSVDFFDYHEAVTYTMNFAIRHHQYASLDALKYNICETCDLISELLIILAERAVTRGEKTSLKRKSTNILKSKTYLSTARTKEELLLHWTESLLSFEGKGCLNGFGFGSKYRNDKIFGNAEKISVTKVGQ